MMRTTVLLDATNSCRTMVLIGVILLALQGI
jgi:hypothetical protein